MITSVLVANRGEIACRVFRTCRELGIATVAVFSDADASGLHVREADAAVRLPGSAPADTYLRGDLIVKAALAAGADAVHPGYGFLSENAEFARAVGDAGLVWIGPPPSAIEAMASKTRAKELMGLAPLGEVTEADLPVLVKAAAGGGGRGMRIVRELSLLASELAAARSEAASAFGDGEVFLEPYIERGRHVEVQILADAHGTVWALGTRDCSLQRRHQKVIEESPAPGLPPALVATLHESAVAAARAVGYRGAGTVEFLLSPDGRAHFLEMNTRLQVEHPVTEAVFGVDLVALQLRVAEGAALPQTPPPARGHAVEARLYAEDPAKDWTPQAGVLHALEVPGAGGLPTHPPMNVGDGTPHTPAGPALRAGGEPAQGAYGPGGPAPEAKAPAAGRPAQGPPGLAGGVQDARRAGGETARGAAAPADEPAAPAADSPALRAAAQPPQGLSAPADWQSPAPTGPALRAGGQSAPGLGGPVQGTTALAAGRVAQGPGDLAGGEAQSTDGPADGQAPAPTGPALRAGGHADHGLTAHAADSPALRAGAQAARRLGGPEAHAFADGGDMAATHAAPWVRLDAGYAAGDSIGVHYDPMIAKVIAWAPTRDEAVRRLAYALRRARVHGPVTNRALLVRSLEHPEFTGAQLDTGFYERNLDALTAPKDRDGDAERYAAIAAALADAAGRGGASVASRLGAWRNLASQAQVKTYGDHEVRYRRTRDGFEVVDVPGVRVLAAAPRRVSLEIDGVVRHFDVTDHHDGHVHVDSPTGAHSLPVQPRFTDPQERTLPGSLLAPMPGTVVRVGDGLAEGARVTQGQPLVWLEAMKMEHRILSPASGILTALHAAPGRQVEVGALLAVVQEDVQKAHVQDADVQEEQAS